MNKKIILASASPRRIQMLKAHGMIAEAMPADVDEYIVPGTLPHLACMYNGFKKALKAEENTDNGIIIAADTIVFYGDRILGKPANEREAFDTLMFLRGKTHSVMTGVAIIDAGKAYRRLFCEETRVSFGTYSEDQIRDYVASGEPMDKAGSYAIQGIWQEHVVAVEGDFNNVIGLPWNRLVRELEIFSEHV